jgi:hypothetical protein
LFHRVFALSIIGAAAVLLASCAPTQDASGARTAGQAPLELPAPAQVDEAVTPPSAPADEPITVDVTAEPDTMAGVNIHVTTTGFTWAPEHASTDAVDGEGHAHLYVDGEKVARLYTPWFHLPLAAGKHRISVTLNGNDHDDLEHDGETLTAATTVRVGKPAKMASMDAHGHGAAGKPEHMAAMHGQGHDVIGMTVDVKATPDAKSGANLHVTTTGFTWAPRHASGRSVDGEGHAHVYVDGEKVGRMYGEWLHLPLDPGRHKIEVSLNGNDHSDYLVDGAPVRARTTVMVKGAMGH